MKGGGKREEERGEKEREEEISEGSLGSIVKGKGGGGGRERGGGGGRGLEGEVIGVMGEGSVNDGSISKEAWEEYFGHVVRFVFGCGGLRETVIWFVHF